MQHLPGAGEPSGKKRAGANQKTAVTPHEKRAPGQNVPGRVLGLFASAMRLFRGNRGSLFLPAQFFFAFHAVAQQRALQRTHIFEVDPSDIRVESGRRIGGVVVNENGFRCRKTVFGQKRMVDAQVGLGQLYLTGSNSAVEQLPEFALLQHFQHVPGNIRKVKHAVSALFQPLDELHGVVLGAQHIVPVVQNNAHLKGTAQSCALFRA